MVSKDIDVLSLHTCCLAANNKPVAQSTKSLSQTTEPQQQQNTPSVANASTKDIPTAMGSLFGLRYVSDRYFACLYQGCQSIKKCI